MNKIIQLRVVQQQREASQEALWQRFVDAKIRAESSLEMQDGIAAGKAFADYCHSFLPGKRA